MVGHEVMGGQLPLGVGQVDGIAAAGRVTGGFLVTEGIRTAADHAMSARRVRFVDNTVIAVLLDMGAYFGEYACPCVISAKDWIESFEPLTRAYSGLWSIPNSALVQRTDALWSCHQP